jgi:hypothetical protein
LRAIDSAIDNVGLEIHVRIAKEEAEPLIFMLIEVERHEISQQMT